MLDAAVLRFLDHSICFRETLGTETLLIFPALIKQKRPLQDNTPFNDDISYIVRGRVENIYATLVVLLGYTGYGNDSCKKGPFAQKEYKYLLKFLINQAIYRF